MSKLSVIKIILLIVVLAITINVISKSAVAGWEKVSNSESPIKFSAHGFSYPQTWFSRGAWAHLWTLQAKNLGIFYGKAIATGTMRGTRYPRDTIEEWNIFVDQEYELGEEGSSDSPQGKIDFQLFTYDNLGCVVFSHIWGARTSIGVYDRPNLLYGYICKNGTLTNEKVGEWLSKMEIEN